MNKLLTRMLASVVTGALMSGSLPTLAAQTKDTRDASSSAREPPANTGLIDINSASSDQLKTLPGVSDAYARKIVENRPYKRKDELLKKKVLPEATYEEIADEIVAKQK